MLYQRRKSNYQYMRRLLNTPPFSNYISLWDQIFSIYFSHNEISQRIKCTSILWESIKPDIKEIVKIWNNAILLINFTPKTCFYANIHFNRQWVYYSHFIFFNFLNKFIYLFLAALGLHCCVRAFSSCGEWGLLFVEVRGLLVAVASLVAEHGL